ncbi:peptidoglycan -binding protein [Parvularcula sp. IMCC14364]|uniref:peptidoglycan -binding protein n=1 Tax=Parvularcula sp. IMCC14364 TaxID=3067902 RepID=UPI002740FF8B|nr:peptidoglycan -binding protein [Parvularcula sp. IMCC14364]
MARRRSRNDANIWPGFVDGLSTLLLVVMFVLSIFVVAQFYLGEELASKDSELARLTARINSLAEQLGLAESERDALLSQVLSLEDTIDAKEAELAAAIVALGTAESAVAASAEELEAEKALSDEQKSEIATLNAQLAALRRQLASLQEALEAAEAKDEAQQAQIENLSQRLNAALAQKVQELAEVRSRFFEALRNALGDRDDIRVVGDRFVFESDILFGSCSATISDAGQNELEKLARVLLDIRGQIPTEINWVLRVDGHADQEPLGPACQARFRDNLQLSSERSMSVVRYLAGAGVPERRLVAAAFGDDQPLVSGFDAASLAQNRRIEFKLTER